ncbi:MAG: hypothetical protein AAGD25_10145 [Cyanobacteria bacterium P01_F01_bin.150]
MIFTDFVQKLINGLLTIVLATFALMKFSLLCDLLNFNPQHATGSHLEQTLDRLVP